MFVISPVDDTHHLLFFGTVGPTPHSAVPLDQIKMQDPDYTPDASDYAGLRGDRWNAWGQDRSLMEGGHFTGFGRSLLEEDVVIQTSMGPILDRTKEHLSSSDVAVANLRRMLLDALGGVRRRRAAARQRAHARRRPLPERLRDARRRGPPLGGCRARPADDLT